MMLRLRGSRLVAIVALVAALAALGWWLFPSNARRIRTRFHALAELVSEPAAEQDLARLARARKVGAMMTTAVAVSVEGREPALNGREQVMLIVARPSGIAGGIQVVLSDVTVETGPDGGAAVSTARARLSYQDPQTGRPSAEEHTVRLEWRKIDGEWLVAAADIAQAGPLTTLAGP